MKKIPLTKGKVAIVDDVDFKKFGGVKWTANLKNSGFYAYRQQGHKGLYLHREIMDVTDPRVKVDHENHDTLDNRRKNLRICTNAQNQSNRNGAQKNSKSGLRGVSLRKKTGNWMAMITVNGVRFYLGEFKDKKNASKAFESAATKYFGEFGGYCGR